MASNTATHFFEKSDGQGLEQLATLVVLVLTSHPTRDALSPEPPFQTHWPSGEETPQLPLSNPPSRELRIGVAER
jgi:hypothetical protein